MQIEDDSVLELTPNGRNKKLNRGLNQSNRALVCILMQFCSSNKTWNY